MTEKADHDSQFSSTLARGLEILRCFSVASPALRNKDISDQTGLSPPAVSRLTHTLTELNYLRRSPGSSRYEIGTAVLSLVYPLLANMNLRRTAWLQMKELAKYSGGWVSIGIRDRTNMVYVETVHGNETTLMKRGVGQTFPIVMSAMGHAYLAILSSEKRARLLNLLKLNAPKEWSLGAPGLEASLLDFQSRGFCVRRGGAYSPHVHTVAVPFVFPSDTDAAVFNCAVPIRLLKRAQLEEDLGPRLVRLVRSVETTLKTSAVKEKEYGRLGRQPGSIC